MPLDLQHEKKYTKNETVINVTRPYEVVEWCNEFDCTVRELKAAVRKVGNEVEAVRHYFATKN
jgi:hypothetical protein